MKTIFDQRYARLVSALKSRRIKLGMDQATVAAKLGKSNRWVSKVEHRDIRLDVMVFIKVCHVLKLEAHRLVRQAEEEQEDDPPFYLLGQIEEWLIRPSSGDQEGDARRIANWLGPWGSHFFVRTVMRTVAFHPIKTGIDYRFEPCRRSHSSVF